MKTIPNEIFKSIYQSQISKKSMILMLLLCRVCDENGSLTATAADLAAAIEANVSTVYRCIRQLRDNYLISAEKHGGEMVITVYGCQYVKDDTAYNTVRLDYINYTAEQLNKLSASAVRQLLYFFFRATNGSSRQNGNRMIYSHYKVSYDTIRAAINPSISRRSVQRGLKQLKDAKIISVGINVMRERGNYDIITINKKAMRTQSIRVTEKESTKTIEHTLLFERYRWAIGNICRRVGIKTISDFAKNGAAVIMEQFAKSADLAKMKIDNVMQGAFTVLCENRKSRSVDKQDLPSLNRIISSILSDERLARRFVFAH